MRIYSFRSTEGESEVGSQDLEYQSQSNALVLLGWSDDVINSSLVKDMKAPWESQPGDQCERRMREPSIETSNQLVLYSMLLRDADCESHDHSFHHCLISLKMVLLTTTVITSTHSPSHYTLSTCPTQIQKITILTLNQTFVIISLDSNGQEA